MSDKEKPVLAYEPWVEDPDPPEDDMTEEQAEAARRRCRAAAGKAETTRG